MIDMYIVTRRKKRNKQRYCYSVKNIRTQRRFSKCTTKKKADRQRAILLQYYFRYRYRCSCKKKK
jgi:hypothetical protein